MPRYFVMGVPPDARGTAFTPSLTISPAASSNRAVRIDGQPGTMAVPAPKPSALPPISATRSTQRSWVVPDVIFPAIYIARADNMQPPVSRFRDNQLPVPAVDLYKFPRNPSYGAPWAGRLADPRFRRGRIGGQVESTRWPAAPRVYGQ